MANSTNLNIPDSWTLVTTGTTGTITNCGVYNFEIVERNGVPSASLKGLILEPKFGSSFVLSSGQSIYARSLQNTSLAIITLE